MTKQFLLASDFDQTLSFNDSGVVLSELIGFNGFHDKVKGLAEMNLVQQGAELSYLILHDPDFRRVRRGHLVDTGKRIRLKHDVALFARALENLAEGYKFHFNVISAAPQEIIQSALEGIVLPDHIFGTRFRYNETTGEGTGFKFLQPTPLALRNTIGWAVSTWFDRPKHIVQLRQQAMAQDFSWPKSAAQYVRVYEHALDNKRNAPV